MANACCIIGVNRGDDAPLNNMEFLGRKLTPEQMGKAKELAGKLEQEMAATQKKP